MASQAEASFECPVCGENCQAVLSLNLMRTITGVGQATDPRAVLDPVVKVRAIKLMGCNHVEAVSPEDPHGS